jgi:hypothetical protein
MLASEARVLRRRWVKETCDGVFQSSRRTSRSIIVGVRGSQEKLSREEFVSAHFAVRRNTLHGYALRDDQKFRDLLAIHDGSIPHAIEEWGRFMLYALLGNPEAFLRRYRNLK